MTFALLRAVEDAKVNPGLLGFVVVALLGVATWLLLRSMIRHLRRVDVSQAQPPEAAGGGDDRGQDEAGPHGDAPDRAAPEAAAGDRVADDGAAHVQPAPPRDPQPGTG